MFNKKNPNEIRPANQPPKEKPVAKKNADPGPRGERENKQNRSSEGNRN